MQRQHRRAVTVAERGQHAGLRQVVDVVARRRGQRSVLSLPGDASEDQPRIDRRAMVGADAEPLASAGSKAVQQQSALAATSSSACGCVLTSKSTIRLPAVQQVAVLRRHRQTAGAARPHHIGDQVGEHHRRMRPGSDTAEFDNSHSGQRTGQM